MRFEFVGLIFGGPYTWRGLPSVFSEFYGIEILDYNLLLKLLRHRTSSRSQFFLNVLKNAALQKVTKSANDAINQNAEAS